MNQPISKPKRFPGVASFEDDALASELFFGRETESQKLLHNILAESLVVVFSYSGYGKTSLLKASVFKKLREKNFYPALIRFNKKEFEPQKLIKTELLAIDENEGYEVIQKSTTPDLKDFFKGLEIWSNEDKLLTPVLVFDQFEELFTLEHNRTYLASFFEDLAVVLKESKESEMPLKMVISIREDFLGHLEKMATNIPNVFTTRFRLEALKKDAARKAITEPASKVLPGVTFASPPFTFSEESIDQLLEFLSRKMIEGAWRPDDDIEPIQLQIICSELENKVIQGDIKADPNGEVVIDPVDFNGMDGLQNIIAHFYDQQIAKVQAQLNLSYGAVTALKEVIETGLIAGIRRVPLAYDSLISRPGVTKEAIDLLIESKLLKLESHHGNDLVEISHDTLVDPILKSLHSRLETEKKERRRKKIIRYSAIAFFVLALLAYIINSIFSANTAKQEKYYYAALMGGRENPTLGYQIALDGEKVGNTTDKLKALLDQFRFGKYAYITNSFSMEGKFISAYISKEGGNIKIADDVTVQSRNRNGNFESIKSFEETLINGTCLIGGNYYIVTPHGDSIDMLDENTKLVKSISLLPEAGLNLQGEDAYNKYSMIGAEKLLMAGYNNTAQNANQIASFLFFDRSVALLSNDQHFLIFQGDNKAYLHDLGTNNFYRFNPSDTGGFFPLENKNYSASLRSGKEHSFSNLSNAPSKEEKTNEVVAMAITNDFSRAVFAVDDSVKIWDMPNLKNGKITGNYTKNSVKLIGHEGRVNTISISPNDSFILTGGQDNVAILWNFNGEQIALLKGHKSQIIYTSFSSDGQEMITADDIGHLLVWKLGKEVAPEELVKFSPFDYHALGLTEKKYSAQKLYDTTGFQPLLSAVLHYTASLPYTNIYPGDVNYSNNLHQSLNEVEDMFEALFRKDSFQKLNPGFIKDLYFKYTNLLYNTPALIGKDKVIDAEATERLSRFYDLRINNYLSGKENIGYDYFIGELEVAAQYFVGNSNYKEANVFFTKIISWLETLEQRNGKNLTYDTDKAKTYTSISYYDLLQGKYDEAIKASNQSLAADSTYTLVYSNLALGHLLLKQYSAAEVIYRTYKQELYYSFLQDFDDLQKAGIIAKKDTDLNIEVAKIKKMLNE